MNELKELNEALLELSKKVMELNISTEKALEVLKTMFLKNQTHNG